MTQAPVTEPPPTTESHAEPQRRRFTAGPITVTLLSIVLALIAGALLIALSDPGVTSALPYFLARPTDALSSGWQAVSSSYVALFNGSVFDPARASGGLIAALTPLSETLVQATPLICTGLAVGLAYRAGLFNIGAEGQVVMGAILCSWIGFHYSMPLGVHLVVAIVGAIVGGALWGGLIGWLKARFGAHEVISSIMLNYIALYFLEWLLTLDQFKRPGRADPISPPIADTAQFPVVGGLRVHMGLLVALAAAWGCQWLLTKSTIGFRFRAVGANPAAARTAGMDVNKTFVLVMVICGGLAGLAGSMQIQGTEYSLTGGISANLGFDGITVALLGRSKPWGTVAAALLFGALRAGGITMQAATGTPVDIVLVLQSLIVLFVAAPPLVRAVFRLHTSAGASGLTSLSKGWNS